MAGKGGRRYRIRSGGGPLRGSLAHTLEVLRPGQLEKGNLLGTQNAEFQWDFYNHLKFQRAAMATELHSALQTAARPLGPADEWCRLVEYRWSHQPLSARGSVNSPVGGRFNIGNINPSKFAAFPALYLASSQDTGFAEFFGRSDEKKPLSRREYHLRTQGSFACVAVSLRLSAVIDLREPSRLQPFVDLIKTVTISPTMLARAKAEDHPTNIVENLEQLMGGLLQANWRIAASISDVPATCQAFGETVNQAGIEGILYPSVKGKDSCLAVFPGNLSQESYIELSDSTPSDTVVSRLDHKTWKNLV